MPKRSDTLPLEPACTLEAEALFAQPIPSTRGGAIFNAHYYPTKINAAAAVACILAHTKPGDLVFDGFAGSGVTGLAATLCDRPDDELRDLVESRLGPVEWGGRDCALYDLSVLAAFISESLLNPPDPDEFEEAARDLLSDLERERGWMYAAVSPEGEQGQIRHSIWTEHLACPTCAAEVTFWDVAVCLDPLEMRAVGSCPSCGNELAPRAAARITETYYDDLLDRQRERRLRSPSLVYGRSASGTWRRRATPADIELLEKVGATPVPEAVPLVRMLGSEQQRWGHMHRAGYHFGIEYVHDFYTRRNLIAVASSWDAVHSYPPHLRDALQFLISSYNASHSTLMTRVVCKKGAKDFVVTSAQPAALYVSSLPVEKNVFAGLRTKLPTIVKAFRAIHGRSNQVNVKCASSLAVDLASDSVDFVFTDPPFGENIQYSEVNFISEAWLGRVSNAAEEVVVSRHQQKTLPDYTGLLAAAFAEAHRILKPGRFMTVAFHSTQPDLWGALREAWQRAGFELVRASVLDKTQTSFKQTTTNGAVQKDPLILLRKPALAQTPATATSPALVKAFDVWSVVARRLQQLGADDETAQLRNRQHLYSYVVARCLELGRDIDFDASAFFRGLEERFERRGDAYFAQVHAIKDERDAA